jgi:hypothetical protein
MLNCFNVLFIKLKSIFKTKHSENVFENPKMTIIHNNTLDED